MPQESACATGAPTATPTRQASMTIRPLTSGSGYTRPPTGMLWRMSNSRLVYSTDDGDRRRDEPRRADRQDKRGPQLPADGVVRVFRETGGRGGKTVTVVRGLPAGALKDAASDLKRLCGSGGAVKGDAVELQGDHRDKVAARLEAQGHRVK